MWVCFKSVGDFIYCLWCEWCLCLWMIYVRTVNVLMKNIWQCLLLRFGGTRQSYGGMHVVIFCRMKGISTGTLRCMSLSVCVCVGPHSHCHCHITYCTIQCVTLRTSLVTTSHWIMHTRLLHCIALHHSASYQTHHTHHTTSLHTTSHHVTPHHITSHCITCATSHQITPNHAYLTQSTQARLVWLECMLDSFAL